MISQIIHTVKLSIRNSNALFALIVLGLMMLTAVTFIGNRLLFANQPDIENVFSIIWTVVLGVILYRLMLYIAPTKNPTRAEWRRNFYGGMIFLCEVLAVVTFNRLNAEDSRRDSAVNCERGSEGQSHNDCLKKTVAPCQGKQEKAKGGIAHTGGDGYRQAQPTVTDSEIGKNDREAEQYCIDRRVGRKHGVSQN